jgi:hypothetical protein
MRVAEKSWFQEATAGHHRNHKGGNIDYEDNVLRPVLMLVFRYFGAAIGGRISILIPRRFELLAHYFYDHAFAALAIKFRVENALPGAEIELAIRHRNDHLVMDQQRLQV